MTPTNNTQLNHTWKFFRIGGTDQVSLETGQDLFSLDQLDQKLWVALSCPTRGVEFDTKTLDLIDTDKDGRIRTPEIIAATKWAASCLKNPDDLIAGEAILPLSAINDVTPEGKQLLASAKQVLANLGKKEAVGISTEDTADLTKVFAKTQFNGDGIITVESADQPAVKAAISDIITSLGAETDRSGQPGINQAKVEQFFTEAQAHLAWLQEAEQNPGNLPLGPATPAAWAALQAVKAKVEDYFGRCRLAAYDPRAAIPLNRPEAEYLNMATKTFTFTASEVADFPLAHIAANNPLPLKEGLNPAWENAMAKFRSEVVQPLFGDKNSLTQSEWLSLVAKLAPYEAWIGRKAGTTVEKIGVKRLREIQDSNTKEAILALINKDKALEQEANNIAAVDKLVRLHRDLYTLLNNFVSFRDFYSRQDKAIFQAGTLYLDQRSCDLCLPVEDAGKHASMAGLAGAYLAYCDCVRKATGEKLQIVAAFTDGDSENLMVGRNGIFFDRKGRDWDATITKIIDNPISIRQAFWAPYKKFVRMIEEQAAKRAAAAEAASTTRLETAAKATTEIDKTKPPAEPKKLDVGVVAALGVGVGAIGTALGYVLGVFKGLPVWQVMLAIVGIIILISAPSMVIAWLKIRKRNLGPILDANGWALNTRARITVPFGRSLTRVAKLPPGSRRNLVDPYAEKSSPWPKIIVALIILWMAYSALDQKGLIYKWTNGWMGNPKVIQVEKTTETTVTKPAAAPAK